MRAAIPALVGWLVALLAIWPLRAAALKLGIMDVPGPRKSQLRPVPYLGGLAILLGATVAMVGFTHSLWRVALLLAFVSAVGLVDDIRYLPVWAKLCSEVVIAATAVAIGFSWQLTGSVAVNDLLSVVWMVGLANSFNLLDNMDGLASTVSAVALVGFALLEPAVAPIALPLAGAALAFLVINRPPARMYMGDAGSLMIGFAVALVSIAAANRVTGLHSVVLLGLPVAVALLDTSLVIVSRLAAGRPVQLGGQDHYSHRLRKLGLSRYGVLTLTLIASVAATGATALADTYPLVDAWLAVPIGLGFFGAWVALLRVDPYTSAVHPRIEVLREQAQL